MLRAPRSLTLNVSLTMKFEDSTIILKRFDGIEKYPVKESHFRFDEDDSLPLNGQIISGKILAITVNFENENEREAVSTSPVCEEPSLFIEIDGTNEKLAHFKNAGDMISFLGYECTDECEVMATLYCYSHINMKDTEIKIIPAE